MSFSIIIAEEVLTAASVETELDAVADGVFTWRNNHFLFTEDWFLIGHYVAGVDLQRMRWNVPSWNTYGRYQLQPTNNDADVPADPTWLDMRDMPLKFPQNEELSLDGIQDNVADQQARFVGWIAPPNWQRTPPRGLHRTVIRATSAITTVANTWVDNGVLTLSENPRGGVYAVIGALCFSLGPVAFRLTFPRARLTQGRFLRPGSLCQQDPDEKPIPMNWPGGEWGRFHTFELPTVGLFSHGAAAETPVLYLDCVYLGDSEGLLAV